MLGGMGKLPPRSGAALGEVANRVKAEVEELLDEAPEARREEAALEAELQAPPSWT